MATWGEYQSVIQLGAALNFGYAAFDIVYRSASSPVTEAFTNMDASVAAVLDARKKAAMDGHSDRLETNVSANTFQALKSASAIVRTLTKWVGVTAPGVPLASGFVCILLLVLSSELYACPLNLATKMILVACGYAWIAFMCVAISVAYFLYRSFPK